MSNLSQRAFKGSRRGVATVNSLQAFDYLKWFLKKLDIQIFNSNVVKAGSSLQRRAQQKARVSLLIGIPESMRISH